MTAINRSIWNFKTVHLNHPLYRQASSSKTYLNLINHNQEKLTPTLHLHRNSTTCKQ